MNFRDTTQTNLLPTNMKLKSESYATARQSSFYQKWAKVVVLGAQSFFTSKAHKCFVLISVWHKQFPDSLDLRNQYGLLLLNDRAYKVVCRAYQEECNQS